jgi:galactose mutarotase-like enzyme
LLQLKCVFEATTDAPTLVNMAQHSYFNLAGHDSGTVLGHNLLIKACVTLPFQLRVTAHPLLHASECVVHRLSCLVALCNL